MCDGEIGAGVYIVSNSVEQGKICFRIVVGMIRQNAVLKSMCRIAESRNEIYVPATNSRLKVLSGLAGQAHGLNPSFVIYDELHATKKSDLYTAMQTAMNARRQPLMVAITTAGNSRSSLCFQKYSYAKKVIEGTITDPSFFGYIREAPPDADWRDPAVWRAANPGWGISVHPEGLKSLALQALSSPTEESNFRQLYLNQWVSASKRWLRMSDWQECITDLQPEDLDGAEFYGGLDLSTTQDLTAFVLCAKAGAYSYLFPYFFLPYDTVEGNAVNKKLYQAFSKSGALITTIGNVIDYDYIVDFIRGLAGKLRINSIAYDPWNSAHPVARLAEDFEVVKYPQSYNVMSPAAKDFERGILNRSLLHRQHQVLDWCADNVEIAVDRVGNIKPVKSGDDNKIDGIIAAIMAYDLCQKNSVQSVYEDRGFISI